MVSVCDIIVSPLLVVHGIPDAVVSAADYVSVNCGIFHVLKIYSALKHSLHYVENSHDQSYPLNPSVTGKRNESAGLAVSKRTLFQGGRPSPPSVTATPKYSLNPSPVPIKKRRRRVRGETAARLALNSGPHGVTIRVPLRSRRKR